MTNKKKHLKWKGLDFKGIKSTKTLLKGKQVNIWALQFVKKITFKSWQSVKMSWHTGLENVSKR